MTRTFIELDEDDKRWLDERADEEGVALADLIRRAIRLLRDQEELLQATFGFWKHGDGLAYQERLRREW